MPAAIIAHLISGDLWAGAEVSTYHLLAELAQRRDVSIYAIVLNEGELASRLRAAGIRTIVIPEDQLGFVKLARRVRKALVGADLVHAHRYKENVLAALSGVPWITTQHGRPEPFRGADGRRMKLYESVDFLAKRFRARRIIAVSREMQDWLIRRFGSRLVVHVYNGIPDPLRQISAPPWAGRPMRIGVLARLTPVKGIELALEAIARTPGVELEIVGDGPERGRLADRARLLGVQDRVSFAGFDPNPVARLATWRALLVTSHHEGNPLSVIEAMAVGTPVLSTDIPGVLEIIGDSAGSTISSRDPSEWAAVLAAFVGNRGEGATLSRGARARFEQRFTAERAANQTAAVYKSALPQRSDMRARVP